MPWYVSDLPSRVLHHGKCHPTHLTAVNTVGFGAVRCVGLHHLFRDECRLTSLLTRIRPRCDSMCCWVYSIPTPHRCGHFHQFQVLRNDRIKSHDCHLDAVGGHGLTICRPWPQAIRAGCHFRPVSVGTLESGRNTDK